MNPINLVAGKAANWCYVTCAAVCGMSAFSCAGVCMVDGPAPFADAAGVKLSAYPAGVGAAFGGMISDDAISGIFG